MEGGQRQRILSLAELYGPMEILDRARSSLEGDEALAAALDEIRDIAEQLEALGLGPRLGVDLGELRSMSYHTGVSFNLLADGPGEPVGAGGRYDHLLARFGMPSPATGFTLDVDNLEWALSRAADLARPADTRLCLGGNPIGSLETLAQRLRTDGSTVAVLDLNKEREVLAYAKAWGYHAALFAAGEKGLALRTSDGATEPVDTWDDQTLSNLVRWATEEVDDTP
jgi:ATP phosphoribosyltransferase regulatory subunit